MASLTLYKYYNIFFLICQEVFFTNFNWAVARLLQSPLVSPPTDIGIIAHPETNYNRQVTQFWEKYFVQLFSQNLLTKWLGCGIIKISTRALVRGPPLYHIMIDLSIGKMHKKFHPSFWGENLN